MVALLIAWTVVGVLALASWPMLKRRGMSGPTFSSVFQTAVRWNGFIALAVAEKAFGVAGAAMVALVMAAVIIPINMSTIIVMSWFTRASPSLGSALRKVAVNPLIIGAALALAVRQLPFPVPDPIDDALHLKATEGAFTGPQAIVPTVLKLVVLPSLVVAIALASGLTGEQVVWLALCASVPTAMNGYVLAREMGGDAEAYAATATLQTALSFLTIPVVLAIAGQLAGPG
jgi:malonate transporter